MKTGAMFGGKYLKADDLQGRTVTVTIEACEAETIKDEEKGDRTKPVLYFQGKEKGLVLNVTNQQSLVEIFGTDESDDWLGHQITLYQTTTMMGQKRVPCLRIKAATAATTRQQTRPAPQRVPPPPPEPAQEPGSDFEVSDSDIPF